MVKTAVTGLGWMMQFFSTVAVQCKSWAKFQCKAYLAILWQWMKGPFSSDVDDQPSQPGFVSPCVREERSRQAWQKWQMVKSLVSLLPFHPLIFSPTLYFSLYHFYICSILYLAFTFSLWIHLGHTPSLSFSCFSVHVRGCEDQWPGSGPLHRMERQFHHRQSWED